MGYYEVIACGISLTWGLRKAIADIYNQEGLTVRGRGKGHPWSGFGFTRTDSGRGHPLSGCGFTSRGRVRIWGLILVEGSYFHLTSVKTYLMASLRTKGQKLRLSFPSTSGAFHLWRWTSFNVGHWVTGHHFILFRNIWQPWDRQLQININFDLDSYLAEKPVQRELKRTFQKKPKLKTACSSFLVISGKTLTAGLEKLGIQESHILGS